MLEAIRERAQTKLAKIILALITVPFALWGIDSYIKGSGGGPAIATVDDQKISQQEFTDALRDQQERMRQMFGKQFDASMLDRPDMRMKILTGLVDRRLILEAAVKEGMAIPDAKQVAEMLRLDPSFQDQGTFSQEKYEAFLRSLDANPALYQKVRQSLLIQLAQGDIGHAVAVPRSVVDALIGISEQQREVSSAVVPIEQFMAQVKVDPAAVKAYYDKHTAEFKVPEQVRLEYVALSPQALMPHMSVSDEEVANYYRDHAAKFGEEEQREAAHILIAVPPGASEADKTAAREKARKIWQEAKQAGANFAELAKKYSQDPGSASKGGDLGFFGRGSMVKPFEEMAFKMAVGDISEPVQTDFGFHIIKLLAVKPAKMRPLAEVRDQIVQEIKAQKAAKKFSDSADEFGNAAYEQGDSLKPAANLQGLKIEQSGWTSRKASDTPLLNNPKLLDAVFADEVLKDKRNTEAIEVAPNTLVSARVLEYKPESVRPLTEVSTILSQRLQREQAVVLAQNAGKSDLAELRQGKQPPGLSWGQTQLVSRDRPAGLDTAALAEVFKLPADKLPAYVGAENAKGGFTLVKVTRVVAGGAVDDKTRQAYMRRFAGLLEQEYGKAYLSSLQQKAKVEIKRGALEKNEQQ